ncbi:Predicted arabinose efflux permease, MFS family [Thermomonospora echinospora]|uniref:Predicted arabinose efflux permease, MFS family n=1 Tax=Thermomonospora echinospora TaxID=1992 RepID=A0A1H6CEF3_9ACTN|nr:MFS transporter [Thermomonospora echinospora]SEG71278.1 Predicted arabinose efflux permease, MFS family [Thermomonospora echinospora]
MTATKELDTDVEQTKAESRRTEPGLLAARYRLPTLGIVLVITLLAFEAMSIGTVMPVVARELHGLALYGWSFSSLLIASMLATVLAGGWIDRVGPARPLLTGLAVFVAGLVIAGAAPTMWMLVVGRTVQGLGSGLALVGVYVMVARVYPDSLRPRVFAATSTAWVLPSLLGPGVGGLIAEHAHWRWVFLGLIPLVVPATLMLVPALRTIAPNDPQEVVPARRGRVTAAFAAAIGAGGVLYAVDALSWPSLPAAVLGLAGLGWGLPRLLPAGALRLRRGVPTTVVMRGLLAGAFFGTDVFIPLALTSLHDFTPTQAGMVLTVGALGWSAASQYQGRSRRPRTFFVLTGSVLVTTGVVVASVALQVSGWWAAPAWIIGGAGMGMALSSLSVLILNQSPVEEQGVNTSALQLSDTLGSSLAVGVTGALVTAFGTDRLALGLGVGAVPLVAIAVLAIFAARRVEIRS